MIKRKASHNEMPLIIQKKSCNLRAMTLQATYQIEALSAGFTLNSLILYQHFSKSQQISKIN